MKDIRQLDNLTPPEVENVIDDLATSALKVGGRVVVVPAERTPTKTGIAAIYRYRIAVTIYS